MELAFLGVMWFADLISGCILISISHTCMLASFPGLPPHDHEGQQVRKAGGGLGTRLYLYMYAASYGAILVLISLQNITLTTTGFQCFTHSTLLTLTRFLFREFSLSSSCYSLAEYFCDVCRHVHWRRLHL